jgi:formate C-acetyltransferase
LKPGTIQPNPSARINSLRRKTLDAERYLSVEQALIITDSYRKNSGKSTAVKRALALADSLEKLEISIDPEELIVGNRSSGIRAGIVFPEAGIGWVKTELDTIAKRKQDPFNVKEADKDLFRKEIEPFWKGSTLEEKIRSLIGEELKTLEKVVKINQKDHAQGHIIPDVEKWLAFGPSGIINDLKRKHPGYPGNDFLQAAVITLEAAALFIRRYGLLARSMSHSCSQEYSQDLKKISEICIKLSQGEPETFYEALQSVWFLFVILHAESNASSFSPGRIDQYLLKFYRADIAAGKITPPEALELIDALYIKFNQIVYMRNESSARYFAGFPIGFNITLAGLNEEVEDASNELTWLFLQAQEHCRMPQPNITVRLNNKTPDSLLRECSRIIGLGTGMPQIVNDHSVIPSLVNAGIEENDAKNYGLVGCVELSTGGSYLGWSDAAMFNMVKVLELTLNDGKCMLSGEQLGLNTGYLPDYKDFNNLKDAFGRQISHFIERMVYACSIVEECHADILPSPFLSTLIKDCIDRGVDVTRGGAKYNFSGIQAIQAANVADSLAVLSELLFVNKVVSTCDFHKALVSDFEGYEVLRQQCINKVPKFGNDVEWVDRIGEEWIRFFNSELSGHRNYRGGRFTVGLYTVSAHVPMGAAVAATPDGRLAGTPLADGGLSPMSGRDKSGPTAVLKSVARIPSEIASNGTLLNMKFLPDSFSSETGIERFSNLLKAFLRLPLHHVQFNVLTGEELEKAKKEPSQYRNLTVRVAGYTAYFTDLATELQDEIIRRTTHSLE